MHGKDIDLLGNVRSGGVWRWHQCAACLGRGYVVKPEREPWERVPPTYLEWMANAYSSAVCWTDEHNQTSFSGAASAYVAYHHWSSFCNTWVVLGVCALFGPIAEIKS